MSLEVNVRILVTGAAGYLGRGMVIPFEGRHSLRLMDVHDWDAPGEKFICSVADVEACRRAMQGMDAVVIAHMASSHKCSYSTPELPFDVNVKGTANLLFAAAECGVKRVCLISSSAAVELPPGQVFRSRDLPLQAAKDIYSLSKVFQEALAQHYHRHYGIGIAIMRVSWILDADTGVTKYGEKVPHYAPGMVDPRDIGETARLALELPDLGCEVFYVAGSPGSGEECDLEYTRKRLNWSPAHDFTSLPSLEEFMRRQAATHGE